MAYKEQDQESNQASTWGKCTAADCQLDSSFNAGERLCSFHAGKERHMYPDITMAINEYMSDYKQYCQMTRWSPERWRDRLPLLKSDGKVEILEDYKHFSSNNYLIRFRAYLELSINARAHDLRVNPSQRPESTDNYSDDGLWRN